jgi:hypothetical protein
MRRAIAYWRTLLSSRLRTQTSYRGPTSANFIAPLQHLPPRHRDEVVGPRQRRTGETYYELREYAA